MRSLRRWRGLLLASLLPWTFPCLASAQNDGEQAKRLAEQKAQILCLQKCMDSYYKKYYGCGSEDKLLCIMQHDIYFKRCLLRCNAPWFCPGFRQTAPQCPANCLLDAESKHLPKKRCDKQRKRCFKPPAKEIERWQQRSRFACTRVCKITADTCAVDYKPRLPNATSIDELLEKIR